MRFPFVLLASCLSSTVHAATVPRFTVRAGCEHRLVSRPRFEFDLSGPVRNSETSTSAEGVLSSGGVNAFTFYSRVGPVFEEFAVVLTEHAPIRSTVDQTEVVGKVFYLVVTRVGASDPFAKPEWRSTSGQESLRATFRVFADGRIETLLFDHEIRRYRTTTENRARVVMAYSLLRGRFAKWTLGLIVDLEFGVDGVNVAIDEATIEEGGA